MPWRIDTAFSCASSRRCAAAKRTVVSTSARGIYLKRLSGSPHYRLCVGDYPVIIDWRKEEGELFVREIGHRRNVYD
jgi:mRNA-degrading endonuclease RelE of RelBE toxin-antitoxin system